MHEIDPFLDRGNAIGNLRERVSSHLFLIDAEGRMIGRDGADVPRLHATPEHILIRFRPKWRRHDVLRAFEVRSVGKRLIQNEMWDHRLDPHVYAAASRGGG